MADYKTMYFLLCRAVSDSLDILSEDHDKDSINRVHFWLQEATIRAEHIYIVTAKGDNEAEERSQ